MKRPIWLCAALILTLAACIKDEPANPEADIETFSVDAAQLTGDVFIDQANRKVMLYLKPDAYERGVAPQLTLSKGATVTPASGDSIFFNRGAAPQYTVTSASGENKKTYTVEVVRVGHWSWSFEHWEIQATDKYQYPVEADGKVVWSSGNPGIAFSGVPKQPEAYPLRATSDNKHGTLAAELVTLKGTVLSELVGIKLFAGSLFLGVFDANSAFVAPLKATQFGQPYTGKVPQRFTGYYKYSPGAHFQNKEGVIQPGVSDSCSIYAVLYNGPSRLDATNIHTSDSIIARAYLPDGSARADFTRFSIPFTYLPGRTGHGNLMMAIVASSSSKGDSYQGAIGSRLVVDSLSIQ